MKKKVLLVGILLFLFGIVNVKADVKNINITDVKVKDKSGTITVVDPVFSSDEITSNITFNQVDDFVTFEVTIENNENDKYKIESITDNNTNQNLKLEYDYDTNYISKGESLKTRIKLSYNKKLVNKDQISLNDLTITINLVNEEGKSSEIIINPITGDNISHFLVLLIITITGLIFIRNKKVRKLFLVLPILALPFLVFAKETYKINIKFTDIVIKGEFETYNITIDKGDGSAPEVRTITYGDTVGSLPTAPTKTGYNFDKWVDDKGNEVTEDTVVKGPMSVSPKYNAIKYNITYDYDGGSGNNPAKYTIEDTVTLFAPTKTGYSFTGWTGTDVTEVQPTVTISAGSTGDRSYTAHYSPNQNTKYKVIHRYQNYNLTTYTEETQNLTGPTDETVYPDFREKQGFINPSAKLPLKILADGSASITYTYERDSFAFSITDRTYVDNTSTPDGTYLYETPITAKAVERPGYTFKWSDDNTNYQRTFDLEEATSLTPVYTARTDTPYKVKHYKMKTDGVTYEIADTQNLTGTTDSPITPAVNTYEGFTAPATQSTTIKGDGTTVVEYYYTRNTQTITITDPEYVEEGDISDDYYYGEQITITAKTIPGYTFTGWSNGETDNPLTITVGTEDINIGPEYTANTNTPYKVKHYKMKTDGTTYDSPEVEDKTGKTDTSITPAVKSYEGFTAPATQTTTIKGTGDTVVEYYYTRNQYTLTITHPEYVVEDKSGLHYYDEEISLTAIDREGYTFAGWSTGENTKTITFGMPVDGITVEPLYTANNDTTYKVIHKYAKLTSGYDTEEVIGTGTTGDTIEAPIKPKTGFVNPTKQNITITGDGEASVTYTYQREEYTFTISDRTYLDNTSTPNGTYPYETEITLKATAREGYTFKWSDNVTDLERTFNLTSTTTLSLDYTANTYYVHFDKNDELAEGTMPNQEFTYGTAENLDANAFTKTGYTFTGWNTQSDGEGTPYSNEAEVNNLATEGTLNLYAQWIANTNTPYKVIHRKQNVDLTTYTDVEENYTGTSDASITPTVNTYTGFTKPNAQTTTISRLGNTVVTYVYDRLIYTVSFNTAGGSTVNDQEIPYGGKVTQPADPTKTNYTFAGWYADSDFNTEFDFTNTEIEDTTTIYAKFAIDTYTVTAYGNTGSIESTTGWTGTGTSATKVVAHGDAIGTLPTASKQGYTLAGWNTSQDGTGTNVTTSTTITAATPIYAQWIANTNTPYTVKHYKMDLDGTNYTLAETDNLTGTTDTSVTPDRKNYTGFTAPNAQTDTITADGNMIIEYYYTRNQFQVSFDTDGGSTVADQTVYYGGTATRPATDPEKEGHTFDDWYTTDQYTTKFDFANTTITSNTTIYAHFEELKVCEDNENITRLSENTCSNNENITIGDGIVCKRAVKLHEETCSQTDETYYCSGAGYTESGSKGTSTITYGSCGTSGTLTSGDAFTCDVNGDEDFDELTERFYYVSDYYDTSAKEFDDSTAVLIYYNNVTSGLSCNRNTFAYDSNNQNWYGPRTLISQLPTTSQWSNVSLKSDTRAILAENQSTHDSPETVGGTLPTDFSYEGYAARLLTAKELMSGCNLTEVGRKTTGELDSCNYIMENTRYAKSTIGNIGTWLETPYAFDSDTVWYVGGYYSSVRSSSTNNTNFGGARPAIEVPKTAIDIGTQSKYIVSFDSDGGSAISDIEVNPGDSIDELPTPTKADSIFVGWFEDESDTDPVTEPYTPSGDITLIAKWNNIICKKATTLHTETCTSSVSSGSGCKNLHEANEEFTYGNVVTSDTFVSGDVLDCNVDGTGYNQRFYYMRTLDDNAVLISYTNYEGDDGQIITDNFTYDLALTKLPRNTDQWTNLPVTFEVAEDVTRAARFPTYDDLRVACGKNTLTSNKDMINCEYIFENSRYISTTNGRTGTWVEKEGSTFYRIHTTNLRLETKTASDNSSNAVRPVIEVPTHLIADDYVVKFDSNGGTSNEYSRVKKGSSLGSVPTPTKSGYYFDNWYTSLEYTVKVDENTIPNGYITYYAKWLTDISDAILEHETFVMEIGDENDISIIDSTNVEPVTYLSSDDSVVTVDSNGHIIAIDEGEATITLTGTKSGNTKTVSVRVEAVVTDFIVSFDTDGGTSVNDMNVPKNTAIGTLPSPDPTKTGFIFGGWYTNTNYTVKVTVDTVITSDCTFHAKWIPEDAVAEINNTFYTTLQAAIDDAPTTKTTVLLLKNVEVTSPIDMVNKNTDKDIILDLNGYTLSTGSSAPSKTNVIKTKAKLEVKNGTISSAKNDALIDVEGTNSYLVLREDITLISTGGRACVYNTGGNALIDGNASLTSNAEWTSSMKRGTVQTLTSGVTTIKGGTIINNRASSSYAVAIELGTVTIGTEDGIYDIQNLIMQGETNGIYALVDYSLYDGLVKGKTAAVNDESKITNIETGATKVNEVISGYNALYYTISSAKYKVTLDPNGGTVSTNYINVDAGDTVGTLPTPTRGLYTFDGWWTAISGGTQITSSYEPTANVTIHARWSYTSNTNLVTFNMNNNAIETYANNISSWKDETQSTFQANMTNNFTTNSCSECEGTNSCNNPSAGTKCDMTIGFETGVNDTLKVYTSDETNRTKGTLVSYTTSTDGTIYNMIPGQTYYWEADSDSTIYGVVKATGYRRMINTTVRNVRDLGGLEVDTDNDGIVDGRIKYGKLFRGAELSSSQSDVTNLAKLGIDYELDLRDNDDASGQAKFTNHDNDIEITNYLIYPTTHQANYDALKDALKFTMNYMITHKNDDKALYFHCTIGTDRTGTLAYFLEGLLGVSEEDRVEDYELSYYFGMTNRDRYHDNLSGSSINPRFTTMHNTYDTNAKIYQWFIAKDTTQTEIDADDALIQDFIDAMIE